MTKNSSIHFYYSGIIILTALFLGGGTNQGIWTDHLLQILLIPALFMGITNIQNSRFSKAAFYFLIILFGYFILQFSPISREITINNTQTVIESTLFSFSPQKSLEAVLYATSILGFSLYLSRFNDKELSRLIRFFMIGLAVNLILSAIQLSYSGTTKIVGYLPYTITSATFANENHFSTLAFSMIPMIAFHYLVRVERPSIFLFATAIISFVLFAVGSRAGMSMVITMSALCYFWFSLKKVSQRFKLITIIMALLIIPFVIIFNSDTLFSTEIVRANFFNNTLQAAIENLPFGTGLGTFLEVYPSYEPLSQTRHLYTNHAHNDFLEILLETGIFGVVLFSIFIYLVFKGFFRTPLAQAAGFGVLAIGIHSLIDYPLRTMTIAVLFSYYLSVLFCENITNERHQQKLNSTDN